MLLRTAILLLLCVSSALGATLGHYQAQDKEEEADLVTEGVGTDTETGDPSPAEPSALNSAFGDKILSKIFGDSNPEGDKSEEAVDSEKGKELEADRPAENPTAVEGHIEEAATHGKPSSEDEDTKNIEPVQNVSRPSEQEEDSSWSINSIRSGFQSVHGYFDSLVELVGGHNGVCQYRCKYGELPQPRQGYQLPEPNGCSSSLIGFQLDLGIPAMTKCCNQLDVCYDTCGTSKHDCDSKFRTCLHGICSDLNKSLGFQTKVPACESMADALYNTVWTLGCRPYMNSQRAACFCKGEDKDEL
ncbi:unnamed protein product [Ophioblennius macclurei]